MAAQHGFNVALRHAAAGSGGGWRGAAGRNQQWA